ncbi:hypothetical protein GGX14DRAFT_402658 [Mycena pura]|uniref:Uncharacterized protein n=1 Tax=Mycena pura TaxID=153505 RepID=A0AAD6UYF4_9AGAR|nr:hypothetical protein GGX14DRAFT_402658 [Mycena pura]
MSLTLKGMVLAQMHGTIQMQGLSYRVGIEGFFCFVRNKLKKVKFLKAEPKIEGRQDLWEWDSLSGASPTMMPDLWDSAHVPSLVSDAKQIADLLPAESDPAGTQAQASPAQRAPAASGSSTQWAPAASGKGGLRGSPPHSRSPKSAGLRGERKSSTQWAPAASGRGVCGGLPRTLQNTTAPASARMM